MTSPSKSVMKELMWLMRYGILNIISLVEPFCLMSPSTCGRSIWSSLMQRLGYLEKQMNDEELNYEPSTIVLNCRGLVLIPWAAA